MKHFLPLILILAFFSCRSKQPVAVPPAEYREKITERLVPYPVPPDSAQFYALMECDSLNNVILKAFTELKSKGMQSSVSFNQGKLSYDVQNRPDTVYVHVADTTRAEKIPYPVYVPVVKKVNELTKFQYFQMKVALGAEIVLLCLILFGLFKLKDIFNIIKNLIKWQ